MKKKDLTIAVLGTQNAIGKAILAELAAQGYPIDLIRPLDLHQESGISLTYQHQTITSSALDLFDLMQPHILFLCEPRIFDRYPHHFLHGKNWIIDCTGRLKNAVCIVPLLNGQKIHKLRHKCLCAPNSATIALANALWPLHKKYGVKDAEVAAFIGAWYQDPDYAEQLIRQTRHFFTQTPSEPEQYPSLAFNLIPDFFRNLTTLIPNQLNCLGLKSVRIHTCFAPVIRGGVFYVQAVLNTTPHINGIRPLYNSNCPCQILESESPLGTHDLISEEKMFLQDIQIRQNTLSFWLMQDPLQTGFVQNAVAILALLIK
ncbi:MAG: hypothetical protein II942_02475 [Alphaproteobacteria bacterium]|nr:hypothetical protein [Alphaproteobacteria bacterium]